MISAIPSVMTATMSDVSECVDCAELSNFDVVLFLILFHVFIAMFCALLYFALKDN